MSDDDRTDEAEDQRRKRTEDDRISWEDHNLWLARRGYVPLGSSGTAPDVKEKLREQPAEPTSAEEQLEKARDIMMERWDLTRRDSIDFQINSHPMERLMAGRTTFIVAHRLATLAHCDVIYAVEGGQLVPASVEASEPLLVTRGLAYEAPAAQDTEAMA